MTINSYWRGVLMAIGTALLWGAMAPIAKIVNASGVSQFTLMSYRAVVVVTVSGIYLLAVRGKAVFAAPRRIMLIYGMLGFFSIFCASCGFVMSVNYMSVPQALILHYTFPLVTMVGSVFITKERPSALQVVSGVLILVGLYVGVIGGGDEGDSLSVPGLAWGLLSVMGLSAQTLMSRRLSKDGGSDPRVQLFYSHLFGGLMIITGKTLLVGWSDLQHMTPALFMIMQYPAIAAGLLGFGLLFSSLKYISASTASLLCTLEIVFALILTPSLIGQTHTMNEIVGSAIIMAAVACSTVKK